MVVEGNPEMQNVFRQSLKKTGYRVLLLSTAERALERFGDHDQEVDCVLFNAQSLGSRAVVAFNELGADRVTAATPAILLLDENQVKWAARAQRDKHRLAVGMPITMKRLQEVIAKLIADKKKSETEGESGTDRQASDSGSREQGAISDSGMRLAETSDDLDAVRLSTPGPIEEPPEDPAERAAFLAGERDNAEAAAAAAALFTERADVNLADTGDDEDYIAYIEGGGAGSMTRSGEFSAELFDAALDDAVDAMAEKVKALTGQAADEPFDAGLSRDSFVNPTTPQPEEGDDSDPEVDYMEDEDL